MTQSASAATTTAWHDLVGELDRWADVGRVATFWWRDDDATAPTQALGRMVALAETLGVPLCLAVIPAEAVPDLADVLTQHPKVGVLQHGWSHANHAVGKKCELGTERPVEVVLAELADGKRVLERLFGPRALPVLVPPWNRIAPGVEARLTELGLTGLSTYGPRKPAPPGLACVNTHVDPVAWHAGGGFLGDDEALRMSVSHLRARRLGRVDANEPTGLLTHHLVMDAETWAFTERFLTMTLSHPAACWLPADTLFGFAE